MKKLLLGVLLLMVLSLTGCENEKCIVCDSDNVAPPIPQGVNSVTRDGAVLIYWRQIDDVNGDFDYYIVYRSDSDPDTGYWPIGETVDTFFVDRNNIDNGSTYYYAVSSVDRSGNVSSLSYDFVMDTPRPQGVNRKIYEYASYPNDAGWDLSAESIVPWDDFECDFYLEYLAGSDVFNLNVRYTDIDIQDMGYTESLDDISYSPQDGWSQNGWCEVILGHTYVIWTAEYNYAKIRVKAIDKEAGSITFDWAYQIDPDNPELKPRPHQNSGYLRNLTGETIKSAAKHAAAVAIN